MSISINLPAEIEQSLRQRFSDLDEAAKEALLVELFRQREISHHQLGQALGMTRYETDGVLKRHGVYNDQTLEDVLRDASHSRQARVR
jgi:hypothetical protein